MPVPPRIILAVKGGNMRKIIFLFCLSLVIGLFCLSLVFAQDSTGTKDAAETVSKTTATPPAGEVKVSDAGKIAPAPAAQPKENIIKGTVKQIAADSSYIIVDGTKIFTTKGFLEDSYVEAGDKVEITVEKTEAGLRATNYNYVFEEDNQTDTLGPDTSEKDNSADSAAPGNITNDSGE